MCRPVGQWSQDSIYKKKIHVTAGLWVCGSVGLWVCGHRNCWSGEMAESASAAKSTCTRWAELSPKVRQQIQEKQRAAKVRKQQLKLKKRQKVEAAAAKSSPVKLVHYPSSITMQEYFDACPGGCFQHPSITATERCVDLVLSLERSGSVIATCKDGTQLTLAQFNYFIFGGTGAQVWAARLYAKLAFEGFFTITTRRNSSTIMLPELQPFYRSVHYL